MMIGTGAVVVEIIISALLLVWPCLSEDGSAAAAVVKPGCRKHCGDVEIPYPFGIGNGSCYLDEWFEVSCNSSSYPDHPPKPFLKKMNMEVLGISLDPPTIRVNIKELVSLGCSGGEPSLSYSTDDNYRSWEGEGGPFSFSETSNRFTAVGCGVLAYIREINGSVIGGCMSFCKKDKPAAAEASSCYGLECCQTQIPPDLRSFDAHVKMYGDDDDIDFAPKASRVCAYAFMVEKTWYPTHNILMMKDVGGLYVPAVLDWRIYNRTCATDPSTTTTPFISCAANARCSRPNSNSQISGFTCHCPRGYEGNPYLTNGCHPKKASNKEFENGTVCYADGTEYYQCFTVEPRRTRMVLPGIAAGIGTLLLVIFAAWSIYKVLKRRNKIKYKQKCFKRNGGLLLEQKLSSSDGNVDKANLFNSKELEKATDRYNASRVIGQGGQGIVYKGMLMDGRIVAVKKLKMMGEGKVQEFINEIVILSQINHRNVVKLLGCCLEVEVPLLVYEFIPNGTLSKHIHEEHEEFPITWQMRLRIATEVAGALSYLHSAASQPIFHRDIKSTNILLDDKYRAKVADFGTSKSIAIDQTHLTTQVQGTFGYLDPEYFQSSQFTEKSDVYSFGIVLIELLTGEKPILTTSSKEGKSLATYFVSSMKENCLFDILDAQVVKGGQKEEIHAFAHLAKRCINLNGKKRPTMVEIAMELERIKKCIGDLHAPQENYEEVEYDINEFTGPWDATTSTRSCLNTDASSSSNAQPLSFTKPF